MAFTYRRIAPTDLSAVQVAALARCSVVFASRCQGSDRVSLGAVGIGG